MELLPGTQAYLKKKIAPPSSALILPQGTSYTVGKTQFIQHEAKFDQLIELAYQLPLSAVSLSFQFTYSTPVVTLPNGNDRYDISSITPRLLSMTLLENTSRSLALHSFVIDIASPSIRPKLQSLFDLPVTYVTHDAKPDLHCIWSLGLNEPKYWWDTCIAEKARYLGQHNNAKSTQDVSTVEKIQIQKTLAEQNTVFYDLADTAQRYNVQNSLASSAKLLMGSEQDCPSFSAFQIERTSQLSITVAKLYLTQSQSCLMFGIHQHLINIEMPWVVTNAAIEWNGFKVCRDKCSQILEACERKLNLYSQELAQLGMTNPNSQHQKQVLFASLGLLHHFKDGEDYSFKREILSKNYALHPAVAFLAKYTHIDSVYKDVILQPGIVGNDGRVHPEQKQLTAATGRQATVAPNILGLPAVLRPLVVAQDGYAIGEVDLAQIEVAIAAGVYGDSNLVKMYNQGDLYTAMAQEFFSEELESEYRNCDSSAFKEKYPEKRAIMKQCTLGLIYGITSFGIAKKLNISVNKATELMDKFLSMFPELQKAIEKMPQYGALRGHVSTATGLHRYRQLDAKRGHTEKNWMVNMPVQGTAAALFKAAGNRLHQLYKGYNAKLIVAMHDAFVFEVPKEHLNEVSELTAQIMTQVVQEMYPQLKIRADINIGQPDCWTKDGDPNTLDVWLAK
ncbi:TPA: DNA polymerase [Vibrio diabolicus]